MAKGAFINLDNTLITTMSGRKFPIHSEDWKVNKDLLQVIKNLEKKDYKIIIVSNQPLINSDLSNVKSFIYKIETICKTIEKELQLKELLTYIYAIRDNSFHFMPNPGMIYDMASEHYLMLGESIFIGTTIEHKQTAINAGIKSYYNVTDLQSLI